MRCEVPTGLDSTGGRVLTAHEEAPLGTALIWGSNFCNRHFVSTVDNKDQFCNQILSFLRAACNL